MRKMKEAEHISGYNYFHNRGDINKCDGVVIYVSKSVANFDNK